MPSSHGNRFDSFLLGLASADRLCLLLPLTLPLASLCCSTDLLLAQLSLSSASHCPAEGSISAYTLLRNEKAPLIGA